MKKIVMAVLVGLFFVGSATTAKAVVLTPGGAPTAVSAVAPSYGTLIASVSSSFAFGGMTGTISEKVYRSNDANGHLLFAYSVVNTTAPSTSNYGVEQMSISNFKDVENNAGYDPSAALLTALHAPADVRLTNSGSISYYFQHELNRGEKSNFYVLTDSTVYTSGKFSIQGNGGSQEYVGFAPVAATPEPATASLLGMGLLGLLRFRRKTTV